MGTQWGLQWPTSSEVYNESQIASVLEDIGVKVEGETENVFLCLCPFHANYYSPAFAVSKTTGLYYCHNGQCGARGNLRQLIGKIKNLDKFATNRLLNKHASEIDYVAEMRKRMTPFEFKEYTEHDLMALRALFPNSPAHAYMRDRGFTDLTLRHFDVGYSADDPREMVTVPVHDPDGLTIGFVGRSIREKRFQNSDDLPKSKTLFNFHRAKRTGGSVIVIESSFDAMRVHQAGYPNVVATLGSSLSIHQSELLGRTFDTIINMQDWDEAGRALGHKIESTLKHKDILWAGIEGLYPRNVKDATDMTDEEIRECLRNAVSSYQYADLVNEPQVLLSQV